MDGKIKMLINKLADISDVIYNIDDYKLSEINVIKEETRNEIYAVIRELALLKIK